jgi:AcrR family transcriptional regulator
LALPVGSPPTETEGDVSRSSALKAAAELLSSEGLLGMTLAAVASRAQVDQVTITRWWPSEEALALDVLGHEWVRLADRIRRRACEFGL